MKKPALFLAAPPEAAVYTKSEPQYIDQERKKQAIDGRNFATIRAYQIHCKTKITTLI